MARIPLVLVLVALLAGCADGPSRPLTLDEARGVALRMDGAAPAAPPPRSITDVTAILREERPDPAEVARRTAIADAPEPPGLRDAERMSFLHARGNAAMQLGRVPQAVEDLRRAADIAWGVAHQHNTALVVGNFGRVLSATDRYHERLLLEERRMLFNTRAGHPVRHNTDHTRIGFVQFELGNLAEARRRADLADEVRQRHLPDQLRGGHSTAWMFWNVALLRGNLALAEGRPEEARALLAEAVRLLETDTIPNHGRSPTDPPLVEYLAVRNGALANQAQALLALGRPVEAEAMARRALLLQLRDTGAHSAHALRRIRTLAATLLAQGRVAEAEELARFETEAVRRMGIVPAAGLAIGARVFLAEVLAARGALAEALAEFDAIMAIPGAEPRLLRAQVELNPTYAWLLVEAQRPEALPAAQALAQEMAQRLGPRHAAAVQAEGLRALALLAAGREAEGTAALAAVTPRLLDIAANGELGDAPLPRRRWRGVLEAQLRLSAQAALAGGPRAGAAADEAFRIGDALRGQAVQGAIAAVAARAAVRDPALADLARREQDLQHRRDGLAQTLAATLALPPAERDAGATERLRAEAEQAAEAQRVLRAEIARRFPDYAELSAPRPPSPAELRAALRPEEALLATYTTARETFVWVVTPGAPTAFAAIPLGAAALGEAVARLRAPLDAPVERAGDIPAFDVDLAHRLYAELLGPVAGSWQGRDRLLVVPHGALAQLPLATLVTRPAPLAAESEGQPLFAPYRQVAWLIRDIAVVQVPSASSQMLLRRMPAPAPDRAPFIGFGDPRFRRGAVQVAEAAAPPPVRGGVQVRGATPIARRDAPATRSLASALLGALPRLPETAEEVRAIARALGADPGRDVRLGLAASERAVREADLARHRVVMFATHGLVPGDLDGLRVPALALAAPGPEDRGDDGLLTMDEVFRLRLDADWVVLSACNTAAAEGAGAEALSGLARAFFYAGTRAVLASQWAVETTSAKRLTTELFALQAGTPGLGRADAMRRSMVEMIERGVLAEEGTGRVQFSYAHPLFWAPFVLVGDGG